MANSVWALSDSMMVEHMTAYDEPNAKHWLFRMMETLPHDQFIRLTVTLWAIWTARRKAIHEEIFQNPVSIQGFITSYLSELQTIPSLTTPKPKQPKAAAPKDAPRWIPPPTSVAKINVDAAVSRGKDQGVAAAFCRGSDGIYLGASVIVVHGVTDPATLEALACREALALAEDLGIDQVFVASDCKTVVNDIKNGTGGPYGAIIEEIKSRAASLRDCSFVFESRTVNFEAHKLARFTSSLELGRHLWLGIPYDLHIPVNIFEVQ
jgi:hypothetical protein